jgi:phosphotransferase system  glucose/maltose/N-acetylglucosamine-specific IIC component
MSRYFFIGGFVGFVLMFLISITSGASIHQVLRNAMVGCILFAFLFRFYVNRIASLYLQARLRRIEEQRREEREQERERERGKS